MNQYRCCVCGRILYVAEVAKNVVSAYCPDRPCYLYPPVSRTRSEDPTLSSFILAAVESTAATPADVRRAFGRGGSTWAHNIVKQQRERWKRSG